MEDCEMLEDNKEKNNEISLKNFEDTKIEYKLIGDYYIPNLYWKPEEKIILNKYGRARLRFLKENKKVEYIFLFMDGSLNKHLKEIQELAKEKVELLIEKLKEKNELKEEMKNTNPLYWIRYDEQYKKSS